jgi:P4 family phage/plasmid primase-like protien
MNQHFQKADFPPELTAQKNWLLWKLEQNPDEPKPRKVPYYVSEYRRAGVQGSESDRANLVTYEDALSAFERGGYSGLGFALLEGSNIVALDFDRCIHNGVVDPRVRELCGQTYMETSPSGKGVRAFYTGSLKNRKDNRPERTDGLPDMEVFSSNGFVTVTGNVDHTSSMCGYCDSLKPLSNLVLQDYHLRFGDGAKVVVSDDRINLLTGVKPKRDITLGEMREMLISISPSLGRDEWLKVLMGLHHEFDGSKEALSLAIEWSNGTLGEVETPQNYVGSNDVTKHWQSLRLGGDSEPVTASSIIRLFRQSRPNDAPHPLTELGMAMRFIDTYGDDLRFVPELDTWLYWDSLRWNIAPGGTSYLEKFATDTIKNLFNEESRYIGADRERFLKFRMACQKASMQKAMIHFARSDSKVYLPVSELNKHKHLLGVANGAVDLTSGELLAPCREHYITKSTGVKYVPDARCPLFRQTMSEIFSDDPQMVSFVLRCFSYALLANPKEDKLFLLVGGGANGKSTLLNIMQKTFGDYSKTCPASTFVHDGNTPTNASNHRADLVSIIDARLIVASETEDNATLNEADVKGLTGRDVIAARAPYAKGMIQITPTWVVVLATNHLPIVKGSSHAIWRRLFVIECKRNFDKDASLVKDPDREHKLIGELEGIQALLISSCIDYQRIGLSPPVSVLQAVETYKTSMDYLGEWIDSCCVVEPSAQCSMVELWQSWRGFAANRGLERYIQSANALGRKLEGLGYAQCKTGGARGRVGIRVTNVAWGSQSSLDAKDAISSFF